jgi:hypothetical protein
MVMTAEETRLAKQMVDESANRWHRELSALIAANAMKHAADGVATAQADLLGLYIALQGLRAQTAEQLVRDGLNAKALDGITTTVSYVQGDA